MISVNQEEIGRKIKYWLDVKKLNQDDLADAMNMSPGSISNKLKGKTAITLEEALNISSFLEIPIENLVSNNGSQPPATDLSVPIDTTYKVENTENGNDFLQIAKMLTEGKDAIRLRKLPEEDDRQLKAEGDTIVEIISALLTLREKRQNKWLDLLHRIATAEAKKTQDLSGVEENGE